MRPLRLALDAFGSYAGSFSVDFWRLGRHGTFAITGPTGAGKSTIFDALVYALYDDLPGFRVDGNVRSQYADPATETKVVLELEVHGEVWRIERRPAQKVQRKRGSGAPVERPSTVVLERVGSEGGAITRKQAVAAKIEELVGLTKAQFEQVVLIPQGRFEEVLKADTTARAPLLRRLFPVDVFSQVTEELRALATERQRAFADAGRRHDELVERLRDALVTAAAQVPVELAAATGSTWPQGDELERGVFCAEHLGAHLGELSRVCALVDDLVGRAGEAEDEARARLDAARSAALRWESWRRDVAAAERFEEHEAADERDAAVLERARRLVDLREALGCWRTEGDRLGELTAEVAALRAEMAACWVLAYGEEPPFDGPGAELLAHRLSADADALDAEQARFDRLVATGERIDAAGRAVDAASGELDAAGARVAEQRVALDAKAGELQGLAVAVAGLPEARARVDRLHHELAEAERRDRAVAALDELGAACALADAAVEEAQETVSAVRASWQAGLAGRLAQVLEEGVPCPTCGSADHPHPATLRDGAAGDEALAAAEAELADALGARDRIALEHAAAKGELGALAGCRGVEAIEQELGARSAEVDDLAAAARRLEELEAEVDARRAELARHEPELDARREKLVEQRVRLELERRAWEDERDAYVADHGELAGVGSHASTLRALGALAGRLARALRDADDARTARSRLLVVLTPVMRDFGVGDPSELEAWSLTPADVARRSAEIEARSAARAEVRRRIADYERDGCPTTCPEVVPLEEALGAARAAHLDLVGRQAVMGKQAAFLLTGPDLVEESAEEIDAARRACEQARTVADLCAGLGSGAASTRLSLENWVLSYYLRQVLTQANARLSTMTDGRYSLRLSEGSTDGRKPWGLDLSVFDVNTGDVRPATTLSGGETFMAALSLALGLADVVSCGSNRDIGALFVDEGFGSLDPESLEAVIDVLRSLEDGGRIVGVISHVAEVTQALPTGISVRTSLRGSVGEVYYPPE